MAMAAPPRCSCLTTCNRHCSLGPCTDAVHGAAGHNRWGVAETPLPVKTQGRNMGRSLTFNVYAVCRVAFNPLARDLGSDWRRPQNWTARTADAPQRTCFRSARLEERAATRVPSVAHGAGVQGGSRSTRRIQGRRPENRPEAHGADSASTPRRATIPRTGGQRPKDRQVLSTFLTQTVSSRSRLTLPTFLLASSSSTLRRCLPHQLFPALSILRQESPLRGGRRLSCSIAAL